MFTATVTVCSYRLVCAHPGAITLKNLVVRFLKDQSGATAIEYGLIAALISVAIIVGVKAVGTKLSSTFNSIQGNLS